MTADRPLFGIALMSLFCLLAPLSDAVAKLLTATVPILVIVVARFVVQAAITTPLSLARGESLRLGGRLLHLTILRMALQVAGLVLIFAALRVMPLADAIAIAYVMPFLMLILGRLVLGETVGPHRIAGCVIGFAGTLLVIRPNFAEVGAVALLPLAVALVFALFMLVTRAIAKEIGPVPLQAITALAALPFLAVALLASAPDLTGFTPRIWALLALVGLLGTLSHLAMTWALRFAPSATLAPMQYLEIPLATAIGFVMFDDLPDGLAALGILLTIAAGLYIVFKERAIAARPAPL
ncbi:DMT family transporter [Aestuariibius sp. 2305UL40-4]|uniref:DMT family transporter n=1 Tax=Aestuariibius violaceus TaxID=3234132 RepID=UPI00345E398D